MMVSFSPCMSPSPCSLHRRNSVGSHDTEASLFALLCNMHECHFLQNALVCPCIHPISRWQNDVLLFTLRNELTSSAKSVFTEDVYMTLAFPWTLGAKRPSLSVTRCTLNPEQTNISGLNSTLDDRSFLGYFFGGQDQDLSFTKMIKIRTIPLIRLINLYCDGVLDRFRNNSQTIKGWIFVLCLSRIVKCPCNTAEPYTFYVRSPREPRCRNQGYLGTNTTNLGISNVCPKFDASENRPSKDIRANACQGTSKILNYINFNALTLAARNCRSLTTEFRTAKRIQLVWKIFSLNF